MPSHKVPAAKNGTHTVEGALSVEEQVRRHEEFLDDLPMVARCGLDGCDWPGFEGTAAECRDAGRAHRESVHPGVRRLTEKERKAHAAAAAKALAAKHAAREEAIPDTTPDIPPAEIEPGPDVEPDEEAIEVDSDVVLGGGPAVGESAVSGSAAKAGEPERADPSPSTDAAFKARRRRRKPYTREEILDGFRRFHAERGRWPLNSDIPKCPYLPSNNGLRHCFPSWQAVWDELGAGQVPNGNAARAYAQGAAAEPARSSTWAVGAILGDEPKGPAAPTKLAAEAHGVDESAPPPGMVSPVASPDPPRGSGEVGSSPGPFEAPPRSASCSARGADRQRQDRGLARAARGRGGAVRAVGARLPEDRRGPRADRRGSLT